MRKKRLIVLLAIFACFLIVPGLEGLHAQPVADGEGDVGIGTVDPAPSSILDLTSTTKGFLLPRMTSAQRDAIPAPAIGLMIFNLDEGTPQIWSDASGTPGWDTLLTSGSNTAWLTIGNAGLTDGTDNLFGTLDNVPVRFVTANSERMRITGTGNVGINQTTPSAMLDVVGTGAAPAIEANTTSGTAIFAQSGGPAVPPGGNWGVFASVTGGGGNVGVIGAAGTAAPINSNAGVSGANDAGYGVAGNSVATGFAGVFGNATSTLNPAVGVLGRSNAGTAGLFEITVAANTSDALQATTNSPGLAARFTNSSTGKAGRFETTNPANVSPTLDVVQSGIGGGILVSLPNASNGARGIDVNQTGVGPGVFATSAGGNALWGITSSISAAGVIGDNTFGEAVVGRNRGGIGVGAVVGRNDSSGYGVRGFNTKDGIGVIGQAGISGGTGVAGRFENVNAANVSSTVQVATNGIGGGIEVDLTNASNGARGIDVNQAGVGPGVFATSAGGNAVWGITSSISAAGVIGDNTFGEAVVGRNRGGNGVGAVVGRNDSSGYGVRGFNTKDGIGVLGQAGISGGTGTAGRFENVNAANTSPALVVATNSGGLGIDLNGGELDGNDRGNALGDGTANQQLTVRGSANAVVGNTLAGNPTVWDLVVQGDAVTTGIFKVGGSMWFDGVSVPHQITANNPLNISTTSGNITINAGGGTTTIENDLVVNGDVEFSGPIALSGFTQGSVAFIGASSEIAEDNTNFFWDNTNKRLGLGTNATSARLDVVQTGTTPAIEATHNGTGNAAQFQISNAGSTSSVLNAASNGIGNGIAVQLTNPSNGSRGIDVAQSGVGPGVFATSAGGNAVWGITSSISAAGVIGDNTFGEAVVGRNRGGNGVGAVVGRNDSSGYGVRGFNTKNGIGVLGQAGISGGTGVGGRFENVNAANSSPALVAATNGSGPALLTTGRADITNGNVSVLNSNGTAGELRLQEPSGSGSNVTAFRAQAQASDITYTLPAADGGTGDVLTTNGSGGLVWAPASSGLTFPYSATASTASPMLSLSQTGSSNVESLVINNSGSVASVMNINGNHIGNGLAIQLSNSSNGGRGIDVSQSGVGPGVFATSAGGNAVWGITSSISAAGVIGDNTFGEAVVGRNRGGNGVGAVVGRNDSSGYGVRGFNTKNGYGVLGQAGISGGTGTAGRFENVNAANTSDALQVVTNSAGNAARFTGNVVINGNLTVSGTVAKGGGTFMIDHPLDPKNKILYHSFVESPDMKNINDGVVKLDEKGEAWVEMPSWFQALNQDFRYQLTPIGAPGPGLYIAQEITNNRFKIAGGTPNMKVSWMVTGIRHDAYAEAHRIQVEVEKKPEERGTYIHPEAFPADPSAANIPSGNVQLQEAEGTDLPSGTSVSRSGKLNSK